MSEAPALPPFTAHNILLPDGTETLPGHPPTAESGRCRAALRDLAMAFPSYPCTPLVADLGCLEGGYAEAFARAGYAVTGIEVRTENMACCHYVAGRAGLGDNLRFEQRDVRDAVAQARPGQWDAVYCGGLLYHLEYPAAFLRDLGQATERLLILDTHCSLRPDAEHEGHAGHWYEESRSRWSAWGNERSFWLAKPDLLAAIWDAGFSLVFEQHDQLDDTRNPLEDRGMFVGVKV